MRKYLYTAAVLGAGGVGAGAFGAHGLKKMLVAADTLSVWNTAVLYHVVHALALLAVSLYSLDRPQPRRSWPSRACLCWTLGVVLFSGSLYALALGGPRWLGPITPLGGVFFIFGWLCVLGLAPKAGVTPPEQP